MIVDLPNWFFSICAFIGFILCMIPLPWHLQAWNTGTCLYMIWTGLACLNYFINSVVWNSDVINKAPVWCDISTKFIIGVTSAIPAASLCINRRLYQIASVQSVTRTRAQQRRDVLIDLAIGIGIPVLVMILHVVVQAHRFIIVEEAGCSPFTWVTPLAFPLVWAWPVAIGLVSAFYCIRTIRELSIRRAQFKEFLAANGNLSSSRYFRLMALAGTDVLLTVPVGCFWIYYNASQNSLAPYVNWDYAHYDFGAIEQFPSVTWKQDAMSIVGIELPRYSVVFCAIVFFAFFGFADEARRNYRLAYISLAKRVGHFTASFSTTGSWTVSGTSRNMSHSGLPTTMSTRQAEKKRDSLSSFMSRMTLPDYGGALADVKEVSFSSATTSAGSMSKESLPRLPVDLDSRPLPRLPEADLDTSAPPVYAPDVV